jgi:hypothetical protein
VIRQIDVRTMLARALPSVQPDLVTRPTGRAVRTSIESELAALTGRTVVVLDFTDVRIIDCSCADEIVAQLVADSLAVEAARDAFFLIRGLTDDQLDDIDEVLRRRDLALVAETSGRIRLIGAVAEETQVAFERLAERGGAAPEELAADLAWPLEAVQGTLAELTGRRLVLREAEHYRPLSAA